MNQEKSQIEQVSGGKAIGEIQRQYALIKSDDTKSGHAAL
jgi:hypothetical protein